MKSLKRAAVIASVLCSFGAVAAPGQSQAMLACIHPDQVVGSVHATSCADADAACQKNFPASLAQWSGAAGTYSCFRIWGGPHSSSLPSNPATACLDFFDHKDFSNPMCIVFVKKLCNGHACPIDGIPGTGGNGF